MSRQAPGFAVRFGEEYNPYPVMSAFVMPNETLKLEMVPETFGHDFLVEADGGRVIRDERLFWRWEAPPNPGAYRLTISNFSTGRVMSVTAFVLRPYSGTQELGGYRIGSYQAKELDGDPAYAVPRGFVEVTPQNENLWVSPHFQLGDFLCKQAGDYPKYLALQTRLLIKLEMLQEEVFRHEGEGARLHIMSAYRTPYYNASIGNRTSYSRHLYGDAADVFVDRDGDDAMDDIDGDGKVTTADAGKLYRLVETLVREPWYEPFLGGLGLYGPKRHRGPFIHVDTRGSHVRWGDARGKQWVNAHCPDPGPPRYPTHAD